jgi:hypothetical protein
MSRPPLRIRRGHRSPWQPYRISARMCSKQRYLMVAEHAETVHLVALVGPNPGLAQGDGHL